MIWRISEPAFSSTVFKRSPDSLHLSVHGGESKISCPTVCLKTRILLNHPINPPVNGPFPMILPRLGGILTIFSSTQRWNSRVFRGPNGLHGPARVVIRWAICKPLPCDGRRWRWWIWCPAPDKRLRWTMGNQHVLSMGKSTNFRLGHLQ